MPVALGFSNPGLRLGPDAADLVRRHSVRHLEMRIDDVARDGPLYDPAVRETIRSFAATYQLDLSVHAFAGVNLAEKVDRLRDVCIDLHREQVDFCAALGARWLTLHVGTCGFGDDPEKKRRRLAIANESLTRLAGATAGSGVGLAVENVQRLPGGISKSYLGDSAGELADVLKDRDSRFGAVFDVGHANIATHGDGDAVLAGLRARLWGVHVHANNGVADLHWPLSAAWVAARSALFGNLLDIARSGIPLIAEHHALADTSATLRVLERLGDSR